MAGDVGYFAISLISLGEPCDLQEKSNLINRVRNPLDTRAGFWLQSICALTANYFSKIFGILENPNFSNFENSKFPKCQSMIFYHFFCYKKFVKLYFVTVPLSDSA